MVGDEGQMVGGRSAGGWNHGGRAGQTAGGWSSSDWWRRRSSGKLATGGHAEGLGGRRDGRLEARADLQRRVESGDTETNGTAAEVKKL